MHDKGIFLDLTPTWHGGLFMKISEPSIVMSPAFRSARAPVPLNAAKSNTTAWFSGY
jgi:hypothetical protein